MKNYASAKYAWAGLLGICCAIATQPVFALMVPVDVKSMPLGRRDFPESAQKQIRSALESDNCQFLRGYWTNGISQLHFGGDTSALNEMLKKLADCPGTSVSVSFGEGKQPHDWQVDFDHGSMQFRVIVNVTSGKIALPSLVIPPTRGPKLKP